MHGPVVGMVWEGKNSVEMSRAILGETDPAKSRPGTVRGDFCVQVQNIINMRREGSGGVLPPVECRCYNNCLSS